MFLTYNAGGADYKMELEISADKDKNSLHQFCFSLLASFTQIVNRSYQCKITMFNTTPIVKILTIGFPVGTVNKVRVLRLKYSVLLIFREVGSTF